MPIEILRAELALAQARLDAALREQAKLRAMDNAICTAQEKIAAARAAAQSYGALAAGQSEAVRLKQKAGEILAPLEEKMRKIVADMEQMQRAAHAQCLQPAAAPNLVALELEKLRLVSLRASAAFIKAGLSLLEEQQAASLPRPSSVSARQAA